MPTPFHPRPGHLRRGLALIAPLLLFGCRAWTYQPVEPIPYVDSVVHYPADGGVILSTSRDVDKGVCVAPPAQGAVTINFSVSGKAKRAVAVEYQGVKASQTTEGEFAASLAESLTKLYEQNEQTLFLQHSLYRLCEAYVNGLFDATPYSEWLRRENASAVQEVAEQTTLAASAPEHESRIKELGSLLKEKQDASKKARERVSELSEKLADAQNKILALDGKPIDLGPLRAMQRVLTTENETLNAADADLERLAKEIATSQGALARAKGAAANANALKVLAAELDAAADQAAKDEEAVLGRVKVAGACNVREPEQNWRGKITGYTTVTLTELECRAAYLRQVSRTSYMAAVEKVLIAATELSRIDVDRHRAEAELAKAEAEKAKAELAKAKADEGAKKNADIVESLKTGAIEAAQKALSGCGDKCETTEDKESEKKDEKEKK